MSHRRDVLLRRNLRLARRIATAVVVLSALGVAGWTATTKPAASQARTGNQEQRRTQAAALPPLPAKHRVRVVEPEAGVSNLDNAENETVTEVEPQARRRRRRRARATPYGSLETNRPGWVQSGPNATPNPNASDSVIAQFAGLSCVAASACANGRPIAVTSEDKRADFLRGLMDDRVTAIVLSIAAKHTIVVDSARSTHPGYVQDRSGRAIDSNHRYGRAADISTIDGVACIHETAGRRFKGLHNRVPANPGPCTQLASAINQLPRAERPTEVIFYFDVGEPAGVALANHADHVHIGFNAVQ